MHLGIKQHLGQYEILVLITYVKKSPIMAYTDISSGARGLTFGLNLHLRPYFVYTCREGSGESAHLW